MKTKLFSNKTPLNFRFFQTLFLSFIFVLIGMKSFGQYSGTGTFTKVTAAADVTDGYYVIAYGTTQAMNSTYNNTFFANTSISPTSGTTITNPAKAIVWKIETNGSGKSISSEDTSVFASYTGASNNIQAVTSVTSNNQRWSFSYAGGLFSIQNVGVSGRSLQYNTSSPRFACYTGSQQDITLYKLAVSNFTLTYNGNGFTSGTVPSAVTGSSATLAGAGTMVRAGFAFSGWNTNNTATGTNYNAGATYAITSNHTLFARWAYTVTYNANNGTGVPATQTSYNGNNTTVSSATPTRSGYTFNGWNTSADGTGTSYVAGNNYSPGSVGNVILYAQWQLNTSPVLGISGTLAHGTICVETAAAVKSYTISNSGAAASDLTVVSNNTDFVVSNLSSTSIATNGTATFDVVFTPSVAGARNSVITVASTTSGSNSPTINLTGTGTAKSTPTISIVSSPANTTICSGTSVSFTATASSTNFGGGTAAYQWKLNGTNVGGNTTTYTNATLANNDLVTCVITISGGCVTSNTATSNVITMAVNPLPTNPDGDITPLENPSCGTAMLIYEVAQANPIQAGVTYYWQTIPAGVSMVNPIVFASGAQVSEPFAVNASGTNYYARAYNGNCWSASSLKINTDVVINTAAGITTQPTSQSVAVGATATFSVTASGSSPFIYQWQESPTGSAGSWVNVGTSINTLSITNAQLVKNGYKYRAIISNACNSITSDVVTLSVNLSPVSIWSNPITGTNPGTASPYTSGDISNTNITISGISRGAGLSANAGNDRYNATGWTSGSALVANEYFEFTLTPKANNKINFSSFEFASQRSNTGPTTFVFRSSKDNFAGNIGVITVTGTSAVDNTIDLSATFYQNITTPITFRIYGWGNTGTFSINDFNFTGNVTAYCKPADITVFPTSGPVNTVVNITGTNFTAASTVKFGTVTAIVEYISATQLKAFVPTGANGNITVDTSLACDSETAFTLISSDTSACDAASGGNGAADLIIYEVYDENTGSGGIVTLYNGTNADVDLSNYNLYRSGGESGDTYGNYATLSGNIASGAVGVIGVTSATGCRYTATNGSITAAFDENDEFRLMKNAGATIVDEVIAPKYKGYYLKRKNTNLAPTATYNASNWTTETLAVDQCLPANQVGQAPGVRVSPIVNIQPTYSLTCDVVNAALSITATEGLAGGNSLTYQWYVLGTSSNWQSITDGGIYSGATSQTLAISDVTGLNNNQYYCQVRENTATCFTATQATQVKEAQNTWSTNVWSNGMPVLGSTVVINGSYNTESNGALNVCELTVNANANIRVKPNFPIIVKKKITNSSANADNFIVESDANLIQQDNVTNTGTVKVERSVTDMNNIAGQLDYIYWSSPVSGQLIKGDKGFSPNTPANGYLQYYEKNDKFVVTPDSVFLAGKGYAIRAETGTNGYNKTYTFSGTPNNGDLQYQSLQYTDADHGFNLVGNPYPSNIDFNLLYALNNSKIFSSAWFWTNNSYTAGQVGSGYGGNNYAIFNGTGGSPATSNPDNPFNNAITPDGTIKVGQAFIVQAKGNAPLDFNNGIRVTDSGGFFQKKDPKNRFWLTMTSPNNLINTILIGYITGATDSFETDFDGELFAVGSDSFYSILGARKLAIQGRSNNFKIEDKIALGNIYAQNGIYKISIKDPEGLFNGSQKVYLKDKLLKKTVKLNDADYTFQAMKGTDVTRFEIVYKEDEILETGSAKKSNFEVYKDGTDYVITSSRVLGKIEVYDAGGRLVITQKTFNQSIRLDGSALATGIYIIKAENDGDLKTKKVIK